MVPLLAMAIVVPWLASAFLLASQYATLRKLRISSRLDSADTCDNSRPDALANDPPFQKWLPGKKGPWGRIESLQFAMDLPADCEFTPAAQQPPVRWFFPGYTKEGVLAALRSAGLSAAEVGTLADSAAWSCDGGGAAVEPGDSLILRLAPEVRSKVYAILLAFPKNAQQIDPVWFRPGSIDLRLQDSGLAPESIALLKRLLFAKEGNLLLADFAPALRSLKSDAEQRRFVKAVSRKPAVLVRLRLEPDADVEQISHYWGIGGRRKDIFPLLGALHHVEKGCKLNITCLLPAFARDHLYRYPSSEPRAEHFDEDCFWSAYNFFNDEPDNRIEDTHSLAGLNRDYYQISVPTQLGDLLILTGRDGVPIHAAVYVADDIYFTKNGATLTQPWILMHYSGLLETYAARYPHGGELTAHFFRKMNL